MRKSTTFARGCHATRYAITDAQSGPYWKTVMQQWAWFYAACGSALNRFSLQLYDVINYNDVIFAFCNKLITVIKDERFTDV